MPQILNIFINRLHSRDPLEREHAAAALADIGREEPGLLDYKEIRREIRLLKKLNDENASRQLQAVLSRIHAAPHHQRYRYGL